MTDKVWKQFERQVAKDFGTFRTPLSGITSRHTKADVMSMTYFIECKYRQKMPLFKLWASTSALAKQEGKIPIVALKQKGFKGYLLVMSSEHFNMLDLRDLHAKWWLKKEGLK